ncbi:MAG: toxin-antitoxin system HicB family antitoxin [Calditrichaceae bacterium]|nr:toxin-antitoxin system HicB family antitoxin [Calditrichaceae bacterium]MBN2709776.1 toxin-antitoxin system HicB family antitoxin [Calditrichaceae bacterium]RQV94970.1 MAG: toxin-antitoxin system HicB family antitoxin [Calditrichota bacterium]
MSNTQVVTLRMPKELKRRLDREAKYQGVSINQLANYLVNIQLTHLESVSLLESRLEKKSIRSLKRKVKRTIDNVPERNVPSWDSVNE